MFAFWDFTLVFHKVGTLDPALLVSFTAPFIFYHHLLPMKLVSFEMGFVSSLNLISTNLET